MAQIIATSFLEPGELEPADVDRDGDVDLLAVSGQSDGVALFSNLDGSGTFGSIQTVAATTGRVSTLLAVDFNQDGDVDLVTNSFVLSSPVAWYENSDGVGTFGSAQPIAPAVKSPEAIDLADIDGDGDLDVISASIAYDALIWHPNDNNYSGFVTTRIVSQTNILPDIIQAADLDGDGDADVLSNSTQADTVFWTRNLDGAGTFASRNTIAQGITTPGPAIAADLNNDGALDVVFSSLGNSEIAWSVNSDGLGNFGLKQIISLAAPLAESIRAADLDQDGDLDILSVIRSNNTLSWFANTDGAGGFGSEQIIASDIVSPTDILAADLDSDGDLDVVGTSGGTNTTGWYANLDGRGTFGPQTALGSNTTIPNRLRARDLDGDGDQDLIIVDRFGPAVWLQNRSGTGDFGEAILPTGQSGASFIALGDIDGNGAVDLVANSISINSLEWYTSNQCVGDPIASFESDKVMGNVPFSVTFTNTSTGTGSLIWNWDFGDGTSSSEESPTHVFNVSGIFNVSLSVSGPGGTCSILKTDFITASMCDLDPIVNFTGTPTTGIVPLDVQFTDQSTGTNLSSWDWDFGDGATSTIQSPQHSYASAGKYSVSLTVNGDFGSCTLTQANLIDAQLDTTASATFRNGSGFNPPIFSSLVDPIVGTTWTAELDASGIGALSLSVVFGYALPQEGTFLSFGELLLDLSSGQLLADTGLVIQGTATHYIPIPNDTSLAGTQIATQGFLISSGTLSNALDLVLGF